MGSSEPFTIKPGDDVFIMQMGGLRRVMCDRITPDGAVFRDLTPDEADGGLFTPQNVSGPRYGEPVSEDSGALYPQEALDAAAAELARRTHGGAADPEDILLASNMLSAAFTAIRAAGR